MAYINTRVALPRPCRGARYGPPASTPPWGRRTVSLPGSGPVTSDCQAAPRNTTHRDLRLKEWWEGESQTMKYGGGSSLGSFSCFSSSYSNSYQKTF